MTALDPADTPVPVFVSGAGQVDQDPEVRAVTDPVFLDRFARTLVGDLSWFAELLATLDAEDGEAGDPRCRCGCGR